MSNNELKINNHNYRIIKNNDRDLLFHVPSSSLYELDKEGMGLLKRVENKTLSKEDFYSEDLQMLGKLNVIGDEEPNEYIEVKNFPATTLILNIASGCNLSCTYCYKADLETLKNSGNMSFNTALQAIKHLYEGAPNQKLYNVTFFGGEPLSNFELIKDVTMYATQFFKQRGANVDFTITTNATLLTKEIISFLKKYQFGITISIDGPKAIHDKTRLTNSGAGSYEMVRKSRTAFKYVQRETNWSKGYFNKRYYSS